MSHTLRKPRQKWFSLIRTTTVVTAVSSESRLTAKPGTLVFVQEVDKHTAIVKIVDEQMKYGISEEERWECPAKHLIAVDRRYWPYLEAVPSGVEKVALLAQEKKLQQLISLEKECKVFVLAGKDTYHKAVVKYKGHIASKGPGYYFGLELSDSNAEGDTDGTFSGTRYFHCKPKAGIFCSIARLRAYEDCSKLSDTLHWFENKKMHRSASSDHVVTSRNTSTWYCDMEPKSKSETSKHIPLSIGDKVLWITDEDNIQCTVESIDTQSKKVCVALESPTDANRLINVVDMNELVKASDFYAHTETSPKENGDLISWGTNEKIGTNNRHPRDLILQDSPSQLMANYRNYDFASSESEGSGYYDTPEPDDSLGVGSLVEVRHLNEPHYGVIRWIGYLDSDRKGKKFAGIEMEEEHPGFSDGSLAGQKYFVCNPNRGLLVPLIRCRQDARFMESTPHVSIRSNEDSTDFGGVDSPIVPGCVVPISGEEDISPICGKHKGIQGHHNSCYLDATLFSMFTFTSVFDSLLYRPPGPGDISHYREVQKVLREEIVNPLRKNYFVRADRVMKLRRLMEKLSNVSGLTTEEKDPEEFLTSLVAQILKADPYLKLSSGQEAYHYQLFVEKNEKLVLPTVQQLFEQSFFASDIKLKEVPPCLIIQMPRFGKSFKMYPRILPSQLLDVTDVIEDSPRQCTVCGNLATFECRECFDNGSPSDIGLQNIAFCESCLETVHRHETRRSHRQWRQLKVPAEFQALAVPRLYMQLFAVVCIETSHYVTFVKCGFGADAPWCFFDSMADRQGGKDGYNIPEVVPCPGLPHWLSDRGAVDLQQVKDDRQLPEHAKRLLCDAYMCMYQSIEVMMYSAKSTQQQQL